MSKSVAVAIPFLQGSKSLWIQPDESKSSRKSTPGVSREYTYRSGPMSLRYYREALGLVICKISQLALGGNCVREVRVD